MKIENQRNVYRIWLSNLVVTIVFTLSVAGIMFLRFKNLAINKYYIIAAIALAYLVISIVRSLRSPAYFYFDDNTDLLVFRHYPVSLFNSRKNSIEIPKQHFVKFETKRFFFGLEEKIIIYQLFRNKVAKYPPISLSAVSRPDRERLKKVLLQYSRSK